MGVDTPDTPVTLRATFNHESEAQQAALALEREGIDALYIHVSHRSVIPARDEIDEEVVKKFTLRASLGAVIGSVVGALAALVIAGVVLDLGRVGVVGSMLGCAAFGFWAGGFYNAFSGLPVNEETLDAEGGEPAGPDYVEVRGPSEICARARPVLEDHDPATIVLV